MGVGFDVLEAAHIFPRAREVTWNRNNYGNIWITDTTPTSQIGQNRIYSPQNGLLLKSDIHIAFDLYALAIDPNVSFYSLL